MARLASSSMMKYAMAACRRPVLPSRTVKNAVLPQPSSSGDSRKVFSRTFCVRGAVVSLESLLPLHNAEAKAHFVSKLSSRDLCVPFLLQDGPDGT